MVKNLINRTIVNYVLVAIGTFLASKGLVPIEVWDIFRSGVEEAVLILVGGGGIIAAVIGAARGISEAGKDKVALNGKVVKINPQTLPTEKRRTLEDIIKGR